MPAAKKKTKSKKWKPIFIVQAYRLAKVGMSDVDICAGLGVSRQSFYLWMKEYPELKEALELARKDDGGGDFTNWVYERLSPELKELWKKIEGLSRKKDGVAQIESLLQDNGKAVRQQLFLHALCVFDFSPTRAMQRVNVTKKELQRWIENDVQFAELVQEIEWHKGNFFEESLVKLVKERVPAAVLFANKQFNREKYGNKDVNVNVHHSGSVMHGVFDLSELLPYMAEEHANALAEAIRRRDRAIEERDRKQNSVTDIMFNKIVDSVQSPE